VTGHKAPCQGPVGQHLAAEPGRKGELRKCMGCGAWLPVVVERADENVSCGACLAACRRGNRGRDGMGGGEK